jgi:hypothetical protein
LLIGCTHFTGYLDEDGENFCSLRSGPASNLTVIKNGNREKICGFTPIEWNVQVAMLKKIIFLMKNTPAYFCLIVGDEENFFLALTERGNLIKH